MTGRDQVLYTGGAVLLSLGFGVVLRETWHNLVVTGLVSMVLSLIIIWLRDSKNPRRKS